MTVQNPHDHFFRDSFSRPEIIRDFIQEYLPIELLADIELDTLNLEDGSFVDEEMQTHHSDMLYSFQRTDSETSYIYLLFEHKSYPDSEVALQLLRYMVRIWSQVPRENGKLRPIVPLVIYHGERRWQIASDFHSMLNLPEAWKPHTPQFDYLLYDFSHRSDAAIRGEIWLRVCLMVLRTIFDPTLHDQFPDVVKLAFELSNQRRGVDYIRTIMYYFGKATEKVTYKRIKEVVEAHEQGANIMATMEQELMERGYKRGIVQGIEQGIERGKYEKAIETARKLLVFHDAVTVSELLGLSLEDVLRLKND